MIHHAAEAEKLVDHPIRMVTLPNGLRLLLKHDPRLPFVISGVVLLLTTFALARVERDIAAGPAARPAELSSVLKSNPVTGQKPSETTKK